MIYHSTMKNGKKGKGRGLDMSGTSWGSVAAWYDELLEDGADTYQAQVIAPNLLRVLGPVQDKRIIDIACGQGFFARLFAEVGAQVTGADISKELIARARTHSPRNVVFHTAPAHHLSFAKNATFDAATVVLALQNIENIDEALAEARRVLTPHGRLVLVLNHPMFRVPKHSEWGYDADGGIQYRRVNRYLSRQRIAIDMHPGKKGGPKTISFHRSLQDIAKALRKNGFAISRLEEWISHKKSGKGPRKTAEDTARKEFPLFMMIEATPST